MAEYSFNQQYHLDTVKQGKEMFNPDGSVTTAMVKGIQVGDKIYNVPFYDRDLGRVLNEQEATKKWLPYISEGKIEGFDLEFEGDIYEHPANVQARKEHKMMDEYARSLDPNKMEINEYRDFRRKQMGAR